MRLRHEVEDIVNIVEIEFEDRANGVYDIFASLRDDSSALDRLRPEELLAVGWWIVGARGYDLGRWRIIDVAGIYRGVGFNPATELGSLCECDATGMPISPNHLVDLRDFASHLEFKTNTTTIITREACPPPSILSMILRSPVELIGRPTILRWAKAAATGKATDLAAEYYETVMTVGTIGLERLEFGRILLPSDFGLQSSSELASRLGVPKEYSERLAEVDYFPLELIREICRYPENMHALTPRRFEEFIAELLVRLGFDAVQLTKFSRDGGRDIIASRRINGIPLTFFFECKKYAEGNKIQVETIRSLLGVVAHNDKQANIGVLVTSSRFTKGSIEMIASDARLDGKDFTGILAWLKAIEHR